MKSTILVLGGGIGGMVAANEIRRQLPSTHRVVVVEKNAQHAFAPSFLWLMTGDREPHQIRRPLAGLLRRGVELVQAEVLGIDPVRRTVSTSAAEIAYDHLIVALGADLAPEAIPGLADASQTFFTFEGATRLRDTLKSLSGGRIAVVVSAMPYKCPGAPHEGAMLIADYFRRRGLSSKVEIHLFTPESQPMPVAGPQLGEAVRGMLHAKRIEFHPLHKLTSVDGGAREMSFDNGVRLGYDLLVAVPPHRAPRAAVDAGLTNQTGWVPVDPRTLRTSQDGVYAIGDVTAIPIPGRWKPDVPLMLPKAGVFAHAQAEVVAQRIASEVTGRSYEAAFCGDGYCMLEAGEDLAGFAFGNFFAEPAPNVQLRQIGKAWHLGKVLFEKWWLAPVGLRRSAIGWAMKAGGRLYGIPINL
ncbi:MAG: NAD(P)/FAD-dependent oxidoreductase [Bryobacteraceae bacterium]|nr:NAD(P)/FAD-dependent oxidoreductase [Solibacteraceae bacterium]MCO5350006.1 NAD(P)/FAD-dependent oxidoreductase [Bryobacteraceae bacterium]